MKGSSQVQSWTVPGGQQATRLDAFVRRCLPHLSLREIKRAIEEGAFGVNDRPGRKGDKLFSGDFVTLRGSQHLLAKSPLPREDLKAPILYEDRFVLVVDKPARMATHGFSAKETSTLANFLAAKRPSLCAIGRNRWEPGLVHRLDQDTSGIVLVAKEQDSFENLRSQFRRGLIQKRYWALVWGRTEREGVVAYPLAHDPTDRRKMRAVRGGGSRINRAKSWKAITRFRSLGHSQGFSLLQVEMATGVTHQIRVHLAAIGHPLVGDPIYGKGRPDPFGLGRQFLHAFSLGFHHPKSGKDMVVESPLPMELRKVLERLRIKLRIQ